MPVDQHSDPFEERLSAALHEAGGVFDADRAALAAGGRARGRRMRSRRRAAVLGGAAGIVLVGVGGALLVPGGDRGDGRTGAASGTGGAATATPTPNVPAPVSGDELVRTLEDLLPDGEVSGEQGRGTDAERMPFAQVVYDDGKGPGLVSVGLGRVEPGSPQARQATQCPDEVFTPHDSCATTTLADGSRLMLFQGYEYPDRRVDTKWWNAELVTPEGQHVSVSEWNSAAQKGEPVSRPEPPLSLAQLKKIATAPQWLTAVDAIPGRPGGPTAMPSTPSAGDGADVRKTLVSLLPDGVDVVAQNSQDGEYAYVVVDDGKGRSFVQINVQHGMSDLAGELFGSAETLPDGTLVATRQGAGDDRVAGVLMWTVDTLRPGADGFRVVISAFNNGAQHGEPTRAVPALTVEQLREIALSPKWDGMR